MTVCVLVWCWRRRRRRQRRRRAARASQTGGHNGRTQRAEKEKEREGECESAIGTRLPLPDTSNFRSVHSGSGGVVDGVVVVVWSRSTWSPDVYLLCGRFGVVSIYPRSRFNVKVPRARCLIAVHSKMHSRWWLWSLAAFDLKRCMVEDYSAQNTVEHSLLSCCAPSSVELSLSILAQRARARAFVCVLLGVRRDD